MGQVHRNSGYVLPAVNISRVVFVSKWGAVLRGSWGGERTAIIWREAQCFMGTEYLTEWGTISLARGGDASDSSPELCQKYEWVARSYLLELPSPRLQKCVSILTQILNRSCAEFLDVLVGDNSRV